MRIVSKEIDQYKSTKHKDKRISEFIIYLMADNTSVEAHVELGPENRDKRIAYYNDGYIAPLDITHQYLIN